MKTFMEWLEAYDAQLWNYFESSEKTPSSPRAMLKQLQALKGQQDREDHLGNPADVDSIRGRFGTSRIASPQDWAVGQDVVRATEILNNKEKHSPEEIAIAQRTMDKEMANRQNKIKGFKPKNLNQGTSLDHRSEIDSLIHRLKTEPEDFENIKTDFEALMKQLK